MPAAESTRPSGSSRRAPPRLVEHGRGQHHGDDADRHVQPEDPVPVEALDDRAADDRADRDAEAADAAPDADRGRAHPIGDRLGQQGQRQRCDGGAAEALDGPGRGELPRLGGHRRRRPRRA
jgi:hypothetical protein